MTSVPSSLVSIVIPTYNREKSVQRAIASAQAQTYPNIEIIVSDNASTDNTEAILTALVASDPRIRYYRHEKNLGPVPNWRFGIEKARGEYVKILFSDDWLEPNAVTTYLKPFWEYKEQIAFTYSNALIRHKDFDQIHGPLHRFEMLTSNEEYFKTTLNRFDEGPFSPCLAMFRSKDLIDNFVDFIPHANKEISSLMLNRGIGYDSILLWSTATRYPFVYAIKEILVHFYAYNLDQVKCISIETGEKQLIESYWHAFIFFATFKKCSLKIKSLIYEGIFWGFNNDKIKFLRIFKIIKKINTYRKQNIQLKFFYLFLSYIYSDRKHRL
jgi:glycosyltransferase involved in cell wall biosynthesis